MSVLPASLLVGVLVTIGRWSRGKTMTIDTVVGVLGIALMLSLIDQMSPKLARAFALLIVVSTAVVFVPDIVKKVGFSK